MNSIDDDEFRETIQHKSLKSSRAEAQTPASASGSVEAVSPLRHSLKVRSYAAVTSDSPSETQAVGECTCDHTANNGYKKGMETKTTICKRLAKND